MLWWGGRAERKHWRSQLHHHRLLRSSDCCGRITVCSRRRGRRRDERPGSAYIGNDGASSRCCFLLLCLSISVTMCCLFYDTSTLRMLRYSPFYCLLFDVSVSDYSAVTDIACCSDSHVDSAHTPAKVTLNTRNRSLHGHSRSGHG